MNTETLVARHSLEATSFFQVRVLWLVKGPSKDAPASTFPVTKLDGRAFAVFPGFVTTSLLVNPVNILD